MEDSLSNLPAMLPNNVQTLLRSLVSASIECFGPDLLSVVLFGSAAEGRLRVTSDVNLLFVLDRFDLNKADPLREPFRVGYAAVRLSTMFVLRSELEAANEAFAVKFGDISGRHRILYGQDLLSGLASSRVAKLRTLRQILLNLSMRLRERYMATSLREEQLAIVIAETASPLRSAAAAILDLEGRSAPSPKEALETIAGRFEGCDCNEVLKYLSEARENRSLPAGVAPATAAGLMELTARMRDYVERIA